MTQLTSRDRARLRKERQRERQAAARIVAAIAAQQQAEFQERVDELAAPAVTRHPVMLPDGRMLVGSRVQVIGGSSARVDPISALKLSPRQRKAARILQTDWREVGAGISVSSSFNQGNGSGDGSGAHGGILHQIEARTRLDAALTWVGAFVNCLSRIIFDGIPLETWGAEARCLTPKRHLTDALDRLADFYWPKSLLSETLDIAVTWS